jgi:rhomboid protease GluP
MAAILVGFGIEILTGAWRDPVRLAYLGAVVREWIFDDGQYWRLLTAMFLHGDGTPGGDFLHLALNLFSLYQVGSLYELMFGTRRFVVIYFVAGIAASLCSAFFSGGPSVGASGAIFGIVGAFFFSVLRSPRWRHERAARGIIKQLLFWTAANILIALRIPQIDNAAHIGGLVAGLLLGAVWPHRVPPPSPAQLTIEVMPYGESTAGPPEQRNDR